MPHLRGSFIVAKMGIARSATAPAHLHHPSKIRAASFMVKTLLPGAPFMRSLIAHEWECTLAILPPPRISLHHNQLQSTTRHPMPLTPHRKQSVAIFLLTCCSIASLAQTQTPPPQATKPPLPAPSQPAPPAPARTLILLDPAHGGPDTGARLPSNLLEKDIALAFNNRIRALLSAANFAVISTRTSDPATAFTADQRAEIVNHDRPAMCLLLHATGSGSGVHIFTSSLTPAPPTRILRWNSAQAPSIPASRALANQIGSALVKAKLPVIVGNASVPPLDNLACPAVAIELAPLSNTDAAPTPVSDASYQQRAAQAIAAALIDWRTQNAPPDGASQ